MSIKEFCYFIKSDRLVILTIVMFAVGIWMLILVFDKDSNIGGTDCSQNVDSLNNVSEKHRVADWPQYGKAQMYYDEGTDRVIERFAFDPNTADSTQLLRLGLKPWQVRSLYRYRNAGGLFSSPSDFARMRWLSAKQYRELEPYIVIGRDYRPASEVIVNEGQHSRDTIRFPRKITLSQRIAVNTADTNMLRRIPGIGSVYAKKIVAYRQRLGGYVDLAQLKEIDGFPESALQYMCIPDGDIRKIKVNKLTLNQLKAHPYINYYQARAIIEYRRLRGPIKNINDLSMYPDFPPEVINRLQSYIEY